MNSVEWPVEVMLAGLRDAERRLRGAGMLGGENDPVLIALAAAPAPGVEHFTQLQVANMIARARRKAFGRDGDEGIIPASRIDARHLAELINAALAVAPPPVGSDWKCPWCGTMPVLHNVTQGCARVECINEKCHVRPFTDWRWEDYDADKLWLSRAALSPPPVRSGGGPEGGESREGWRSGSATDPLVQAGRSDAEIAGDLRHWLTGYGIPKAAKPLIEEAARALSRGIRREIDE